MKLFFLLFYVESNWVLHLSIDNRKYFQANMIKESDFPDTLNVKSNLSLIMFFNFKSKNKNKMKSEIFWSQIQVKKIVTEVFDFKAKNKNKMNLENFLSQIYVKIL